MIRRSQIAIAVCILFLSQASWAAGKIEGDVRLSGDKPKASNGAIKIIDYSGPCGTQRSASVIELWKDRVTDVTLWLTIKDGAEQANPEPSPKEYSITGWKCDFWPAMSVVEPGSTIKIANEDPFTQWLLIEEDGKNMKQVLVESGGTPHEMKLNNGFNVHLESGFYPWMEAWIRPVANLVATTEMIWDGRFFFKDIPAGEYTIHAWHPALGDITEDVTVIDDKTEHVVLKYDYSNTKDIPIIEATMLEQLFGGKKDTDNNPFKE